MIRVKYKKPFCFEPIRTPNKPMDRRPVKPWMDMQHVSDRYDIPLSTLYKYYRDRECTKFPEIYIRMTNKNRKYAFVIAEIEYWYQNTYLKHYAHNAKNINKKVIDNILN